MGLRSGGAGSGPLPGRLRGRRGCADLRAGVAAARVAEGVAVARAVEHLALHVCRVARDEAVRRGGAWVEAGVAAEELDAARGRRVDVALEPSDGVDRTDRG